MTLKEEYIALLEIYKNAKIDDFIISEGMCSTAYRSDLNKAYKDLTKIFGNYYLTIPVFRGYSIPAKKRRINKRIKWLENKIKSL